MSAEMGEAMLQAMVIESQRKADLVKCPECGSNVCCGAEMSERIEELEKLLKVAACPANCDGGTIPHGPNPDGVWEAQQCQFCDERSLLLADTERGLSDE